jgi:hypothetical protein
MAKRPDAPGSRAAARGEGAVGPDPTTGSADGGAETRGGSRSERPPGPRADEPAKAPSGPSAEGEADRPDGEPMDSPEYRPRPDADKTAPVSPDSKHG